ncbi:Sulfotransferase domain [Macleaya cordata]|uniref:Sulfotransferase n=1 Tax=Macleaya cordata TaxID=56857 RepID=A0A200R132_MACCD|nr:Sulfotransferase domain [Macleaya cordata]
MREINIIDHQQHIIHEDLSLPIGHGWRGLDNLYYYQGFWCPDIRLEATIEYLRNFHAKDTDLIIATLPRSGTLWLKSMAYSLINRARYNISSKHHPLRTDNRCISIVPFLEFYESHIGSSTHEKYSISDLANFSSPRLLSTHVPYLALPESIKNITNCKIVYSCRNPKDNFISLWHFFNKMAPKTRDPVPLDEEALDLFCNGVSAFGPFWDHVLGYWKESLENPQKVLFLKYEDVKKNPRFRLKRIAEFLGYPLSLEEESEGKGEVGDWKNYLTLPMAERIDRPMEEKLQGSGLVFQDYLED